ncbi:MAG: glycosyltransferase family 39 protein [Chloroflexota bacterium]
MVTRFFESHSVKLLLVAILLTFALRVNCLHCQSLWLDEASSAYRTTLALPAFFQDTADNLQAPGYFLLLRGWVALAGMSAFSLRYFSVLSGILFAPVAYAFVHRFLNHSHVAVLTVILIAINPAHIYYSQETRMYAVLPVLYLLMLGLAMQLWRRPNRLLWIAIAILEVFAVYLHLFSTFMLVTVNLLLAFEYFRRRSTAKVLRPWIVSQLIVFLAILPWLWFTWRSGGSLPANLDATAAGAASFSVQNYLGELWPFLWTGLTGLRPVFVYWSLLLAALLFLGLALTFSRGKPANRRALLALLLAVGAPLLLGAFVWTYNPLTHPRYLVFLAAPLTILLAQALASLAANRVLRLLVPAGLLLILLLDVSALRAVRIDPEHRRYDAAALASAIADRAEPGDVVLMPPNDRSLWYYDPAPASAENWPFAGGKQEARAHQMARLLEGHQSAFLVEYHDLYSYDPHGQVRYLLEANGYLLEQFTVDRMDVYHIALHASDTPQMAPLDKRCGPLRLTGAAFPQAVQPGDALSVALRWRLEEDSDEAFVASARLMDGTNQIAGADRRLLSEQEASTTTWQTGTEATTYFVLPIPLGTHPQSFDLAVLLHSEDGETLSCGNDDDALHLGQMALTTADQRTSDAYGTWQDALWHTPSVTQIAGGLQLESYNVRPTSLRPGQPAYVTLRWRATDSIGRDIHPELLVGPDGESRERIPSELFTEYPTSRWRPGDLFIETRELRVPATLEPFPLQIIVDDVILTIGDLRIDLSALQWRLPAEAIPRCAQFPSVGALQGYQWQLSEEETSATLTLYWQGGDEAPAETSYTVFAQLQAPDGWVLAQDDDLPADGERPTTTWLPAEIIADQHHIPLPDNLPPQTRLAVGLYELDTLERVPAFDCDGNRLPDDAVIITP